MLHCLAQEKYRYRNYWWTSFGCTGNQDTMWCDVLSQ